jgi:WD40 repeat protein
MRKAEGWSLSCSLNRAPVGSKNSYFCTPGRLPVLSAPLTNKNRHLWPPISDSTILRFSYSPRYRASPFFCFVLIFAISVGCGESTKDAMMRVARKRAEAKEREAAEDKAAQVKTEKEKQAQSPPAAEAPSAIEVAANKPAAPALTSTATNPVASPAAVPAPTVNSSAAIAPAPQLNDGQALTLASNFVLRFDQNGRLVVYSGDGNSLGVHDVGTKALVRRAYNDQLTPSVAAIDEMRSQLVVGGADGMVKTFALGTVKGLDRYAQERLLRRDREPPRQAHTQSVSAIAINSQAKILATGDVSGELRIWSADTADSVSYPGGEGGFVKLRAYQKDLVFALTKQKKLLFWKTGQAVREPTEYATFNDPPTVMQVGPKGKGMVIGDDSGRVTMWLPEGSELKKQSFQAHSTAVSGISFNAAGDTLITASRSGELLKWNLPLNSSQIVDLEETPRFLTMSNNGRLLSVPSRKSYLDVYSASNNTKLRSFQLPGDRRVTASGFSNDNRVTVVGDDAGTLHFFGNSNEPFASLSVGTGSIENVVVAPKEELIATSTQDGTLAVVATPTSEPSFTRTPPIDLAVADEAGTKILVAARTGLQVVDTATGAEIRSTTYGGATVTAAYIDATLALLGNEKGEVFRWVFRQEGSVPEMLNIPADGKPIASLSLTKFGQVWTCDFDGACKFATIGNAVGKPVQTEPISGSFKQPVARAGSQSGRAVLLSGEGNLLVAKSVSDAPIPLTSAEFSKLSDFQTNASGVFATSQDKLRLHHFDSTGKWIGSTSLGPEHGEIARFDGGKLSYSILTKAGHLIAGVSGQPEGINQVLASGELRSVQITPDGNTVVAETPEGVLHLSVGGNKSQKLKLNNSLRVLAVAPDGQAMITVNSEGAECMNLNAEQPRVLFGMPAEVKTATAARFSANGRELYLAAEDGGIYQVSRNDGSKANLLVKLDTKLSALHLNAAGDRMLVQASDGRVLLLALEAKTAKSLFDSQDQKFTCTAIAGTRFLLGDASGGLHELTENPADKRELLKLGSVAVVRLTGDVSGERCVAETADKQLHQINLKDAVWYSSKPKAATGDCLGLCLNGSKLTRVDTLGNLLSVPTTMGASVLGPEANVRALANTADGRWLLAVDARGKLARWPVSAEGIGKPLRCAIELTVDDLRPFPTDSLLCLLSKANGLVNYNVAQDRSAGVVKAKLETSSIETLGLDQTVVLKQGTGYAVADFRTGKLESLGAEAAETAGLIQLFQDETYTWLAVTKSGEYRSAVQAGSGKAGTGFQVGSKVKSSSIRNGLVQMQANDTVSFARADGSQLPPFKLPGGQLVASAMGSNSASFAAGDSTGSVWFFGEGAKAPKSVALPSGAVITSVIWDTADTNVAVATEKEIYVIDALTTKVRSKFKTQSPMRTLVRWGDSGLWCVGKDQRLTKLTIAKAEWVTRLPAASSVLAWHAGGKEIVSGAESGTLTAFDAKLGNQVAKVEIGKGQLRAICPLKSSDKLIMLAGRSSILNIDSAHRVTETPVSSALQLSSVATDNTGRWLYATNNVGEVLAWDMTNLAATPKTIPCELRSSQIRFTEGAKLASISNSRPALAFTPSTASQNAIAKGSGLIEDFSILPDDSYVAIADGSSAIQLVGLIAEQSKQLVGNSVGYRMVATHPRGLRIGAAGPALGKPGAKLTLWDTADLKTIREVDLPANPTRLTYSADGVLIAVSMDDGGCHVYDGATGVLLESLPTSPGLNTVEFTEDGRRLLLAKQDGTITVQPLTSIGVVKASDVAIVALNLHSSGKFVYAGDAAGRISLRAVDSLAQPQVTLLGVSAPLLQMKLSSDSRTLLAVYDDTEHSVLVWKLDVTSGMPASGAPDTVIRSPESRNTCASFTIDSQYLLLGGEDGLIRAWSIQENREVSRFRGHTSAVRDVAPYLEAGRFVSGGVDKSLRSWRFPGNLPRSGDPVPDGALVEATEMQQVTVPTESATKEEDRMAAAREALISGNPNSERAGEIFSLLSTNPTAVSEAKSSNSRLRALERDPQASLNEIYQERLRNSQILRRLQSGDNALPSIKFENALLQAQTNFRFDTGENSRPVKLRFSDRFLYAACPSVPKRPVNPDKPQPDLGDNGALLSWEYRVTQLPSREWLVDEISVNELLSFPNYEGAVAAPSMTIFSQHDGSSNQLPYASSWDASQAMPNGKQLFAVGSAGANRAESEILRVYDVAKLRGDKIQPISRYTSFEGVVTAMAFSNASFRLAFCVRERAVHRLYVADADRLEATIVLVEEFAHKRPWISEGKAGAPGITSLAFTSDDRTLVAHGRYDDQLYRFSAWRLNADSAGTLTALQAFGRESKEAPFLSERSSRPICFVMRPGDDIMIAENVDRYVVWNVTSGESKSIPFLPMQNGLPQRCLSDDGKWLIMGDDRGNAYVYDVLRGDRYSVAYNRELEQPPSMVRDKNAKEKPPKAVERPAHAGPIAGVTLSAPGARGDFPEFAATIGEENRLIVWDLIPVLSNRVVTPLKPTKRVSTQ